MNSKRNCTIDILRLVFSILIVALHTSPFIEFSVIGSYLFSQALSRLAVPFFGAVAGYFFFRDQREGKYLVYIRKYLLIYTFWSLLMYIYDALRWNNSRQDFIVYILKTYFLIGWKQLWYLLAVIYTIVILAILNKISQRINDIMYVFSFALLAIGIAINNYGSIFLKVPVLSIFRNHQENMIVDWWFLLIPFFMMGFGLNKNVSEKYIKKALPLTLVCIAGLLMEIMFTTYFRLHNNVVLCLFTYPAIFFLLVWALNHPYPGLYRIAKYCAGMASVMYLGHCVITNYMQSFHVSETATFMTGVLITALVGFVLTRTDHPFVNKLF